MITFRQLKLLLRAFYFTGNRGLPRVTITPTKVQPTLACNHTDKTLKLQQTFFNTGNFTNTDVSYLSYYPEKYLHGFK